MNTRDRGIDYGMGKTNVCPKTGIRYGVIPMNRLAEYAYEDFEADYGKPHCPKCGNEAADYNDYEGETDDWGHAVCECDDYICPDCEYVFGCESAYGDEPVDTLLDQDGYLASLDEHGDVFIIKSPYYTHAQFCSPCAPGAGYCLNTCEDGVKTYCMGRDWFEGEVAPYPVYSVKTGELVSPRR